MATDPYPLEKEETVDPLLLTFSVFSGFVNNVDRIVLLFLNLFTFVSIKNILSLVGVFASSCR